MANRDSKVGEKKEMAVAATRTRRVDENSEGEHWRLVGMDVGKQHCQLCIELSSGVVVERRIATDRERLEDHFAGRASVKALIEAGTESEWIAQCLEALGHRVLVADPNFAPMYATRSRKIKTDRRDAIALLDALRAGTYRLAYRRSEEQRDVRIELMVRDQLVRARTKCINVCRAVLRQYGLRVPEGEAENFVERARPIVTEEAVGQKVKEAVEQLLEQMLELNIKIERMETAMQQQAKGSEPVQRLMTAPGVGMVTALAVVSLVDRPERFENAKQVRSYLGLVPGEYSSGEGQRRTSITKTGDGLVRRLLVQCAHSLMRTRGVQSWELRAWTKKIADKSGRKKAMVALARKLAGLLWAMLRDGTVFGQKTKAVVATEAIAV